MKILELFSGTRSVGKCCDALGWESISVDLLLPADHQIDIMEFDYKQYDKDEFDIIWASPPCVAYSRLQNCWLGRKKKDGIIYTKEIMENDMKEGDKLVMKALEIIEYFNPVLWFIENPATGKLKDREFMKDIPFYDVDYCKYSDWGYKKKTRIWTNKKDWNALICHNDCENMVITDNQKIHKERMGTSKTVMDGDKIVRVNTAELREKYKDYPNMMVKKQHKKVLGNGYEIIDGEKVLCNTKEKRMKHRLNVSKDVHTVGEKKTKHKLDVSITVGGGTNKLDRYRVPEDLIFSLFMD